MATILNAGTTALTVTPDTSGALTIQTNGTNALAITANGQITTANTPFILTGGRLQFPGTQIASGDANCLDDYEEGTWTPTMRGFSAEFDSVTYTGQKGRYTKIGKLVTCQGQVEWSSKSGGSGVFCLAGLPFSSSDGLGNPVINIQEYNGFTFSGRTQLGGEIFSSIVYFIASGTATTPVAIDVSNVASSGYFYFSFSYIATA